MKIKNKIATLLVGIALLASCSDDIVPTYTVGEADNAIVLRAGISDGSKGVQTRAAEYGTHSKHLGFATATQIALRVDGTWTGHVPVAVKTKTVATLGTKVNEHNPLNTYSPNIYWDDYGTADPANATTGRTQGLTIYGAAVDGKNSLPTTLSSLDGTQGTWQALSWNVGTPTEGKITQTGGFGDYDLLTSNNVSTANSNAYKFSQKNDGKLLEFTHAMTKVTVNLTAGKGFPNYTAEHPENATFVASPEVTLVGFNYTGTVNVETKTSTPTPATTTNILTKLTDGGAGKHTAKYEALVFPGNLFADATEILNLSADGNDYAVTAAKLNAAIQTAIANEAYKGTDNTLLQAVNYVINIIVNKTDIDVEATIKDWDEVSATNETPVINISDAYGHTGGGFNKSFDFYRSTAVGGSYLSGITEGNHTVVNYVAAAGEPVVPAHYTMANQMYWPNHSTHYFFRGIWPLVNSVDGESQQLGPTSAQVKANSIEVANVAYKQGYYPSDLMIGRPRNLDGTPDETCKVAGHDKSSGANGICATEGKIRMNFQYAMSQVLVELTTSDGNDKVIFDGDTKVEIIGGYTQGEIKLSDESSDFTGKSVTDYFMHNIANDDYDSYRDAIIPQSLVDGSGNATLKFRITVKSGDSYDKYETVLGIKDIPVTINAAQHNITAWEPGKKYTYTLRITKTGIKVEATLKDWVDVTAGTDIWF